MGPGVVIALDAPSRERVDAAITRLVDAEAELLGVLARPVDAEHAGVGLLQALPEFLFRLGGRQLVPQPEADGEDNDAERGVQQCREQDGHGQHARLPICGSGRGRR